MVIIKKIYSICVVTIKCSSFKFNKHGPKSVKGKYKAVLLV